LIMTTDTQTRQVQVPAALLASLLAAIVSDREPAHAVERLRQAGFDAGESLFSLFEEHASDRPATLAEDRFWREFAGFWEGLGWGALEHRQAHPGVAELISADWIEAGASAEGFGCQVTTGLFADLLTRIAGEDVAVSEVECRGRGDERCRFLIGSPAALQALYEAGLSSESADDWLARTA